MNVRTGPSLEVSRMTIRLNMSSSLTGSDDEARCGCGCAAIFAGGVITISRLAMAKHKGTRISAKRYGAGSLVFMPVRDAMRAGNAPATRLPTMVNTAMDVCRTPNAY